MSSTLETYDVAAMTPTELDKLLKGNPLNKWRNVKCEDDGERFDSMLELNHYRRLEVMQRAGLIRRLRRQQWVTVQPTFSYGGRRIRAIRLRLDFMYEELDATGKVWQCVYDDTKGAVTDLYAMKWKLLQFKFRNMPGVILRLTYQ